MRAKVFAHAALLVAVCAVGASAMPRSARHGRTLQATEICSTEPIGGMSSKPTKASIFNELSTKEIYSVVVWMLKKYPSLKFPGTIPKSAGLEKKEGDAVTSFDNYIFQVILLTPPKKAALAWLDGKGPKPKRYAKVIVVRGAAEPRDVMEYKVGPLPLGGSAKAVELFEPGFVPYHKKPEDGAEYGWMEGPVGEAADKLKDVFYSMAGGKKCYGPAKECGYDSFSWWSQASLLEDNTRVSNVQFWYMPRGASSGNEYNMMPMPLYMRLNHTAANTSEWFIIDLIYCNQGPFATPEALLKDFKSGKIKKCETDYAKKDYDFDWARSDVARGPRLKESGKKAGPRTIWPEGQRFKLADTGSETGRSFSWMGWKGHVTVDPYSGFQFFDISFMGKRIVYELAIEELYANYAGYSLPGQVVYFDSIYGIGAEAKNLRNGVDCPEGAVYAGLSFMDYSQNVAHVPRAVCFFEDDLATSDWRHTHGSEEPFTTGVRSTDFVVRMVTTPDNYDYIQTYRFRLDGSIEVDIRMGGYMSTAYYDAKNGLSAPDKPYMSRVHTWTAGVIHDHIGLWKVDLDVLGTSNRMVKKSMKFGSYSDAGVATPGWGVPTGFKYMKEEVIEKEGGFTFNYQVPSTYAMQAMNETNKWGSPRSYAVAVGYTTSQLLPADHPVVNAQYWTTNHIWTTVRKDEEERGHYSIYDYHDMRNSLFSMKNYVDGEDTVGKDLVMWVTMGVQHVPRSEDVPLITNHGSTFSIKPWNYFDELATMDIVDKFDFDECTPDLGDPSLNKWGA